MFDVSQGGNRARKWPEPRGPHRSQTTKEQNDLFRDVQLAAKLMSSANQLTFREATDGTPYYPRDLATSMMYGRLIPYVIGPGFKAYSMATVRDVSDSLDALSSTPGQILRRGDDLWEGVDYVPSAAHGIELTRGTYTIPSGATWYPLAWASAIHDDSNGWWDIATPTDIVVDSETWYSITFNCRMQQGALGFQAIRITNNGTPIATYNTRYGNSANYNWMHIGGQFWLQAGDIINLEVYNAQGTWNVADPIATILQV